MYLICIKQNMEEKMEELVKQAKMGNDEAFTQLIIQMQCEMFRIAQIRLKNIDDANDAIQQTNLYAYKNLRQLKEDKYFKTWIIKILINECNKVYKKNYKILNIFEPIIFPIAISLFPFIAAVTLVTSSGKLVPTAKIVKLINFSLKLK